VPVWPRTMSGDDLEAMLGLVDDMDGARSAPQPTFCQASAPKVSVVLSLERSLSEADTATPLSECSLLSPSLSSASVITSGSESPSAYCEDPKLAALVRQECAWLKITSCKLMQLEPRSSKTKRATPCSVTKSLRICVAGLPSLKRHKWQQPLSRAVAGVLERMECPAFVRRGELFASLDTMEGGEMVRVDLCAPRDSDEE